MLTKVLPNLASAVARVRSLIPQGAPWDSSVWGKKLPDLRERSFFSSRVESVRALSLMQQAITDALAETVETLPNGKRALKVNRATFIDQFATLFRDYPALLPKGSALVPDEGDLRDIRSERRLALIYDTNVRQVFGYGGYIQGRHPIVLQAFPAQRFVRLGGRDEPRPRHVAAEGQVRLKTDKAFWLHQNAREIGGFEVPYGPWGFNSGMSTLDVARDETVDLGLLRRNQTVEPGREIGLNEGLRASLQKVNPALRRALKQQLTDKYVFGHDDSVRFRN